jgi:hypothetical protein
VATKKSKKSPPTKKVEKKQNELITVMVLSLILGIGGGYLIGAAVTDNPLETSSSMSADMNTTTMHSTTYEVPADQAPKVELVVVEDAKSGYNIKIITTDFMFTPENVNGDNVVGEGHAHLYVDGEKIGRVYGNYYHYNGSFEGTKTFMVTLNANDHSEYTVDGEPIVAKVAVTHDGSDPAHDDVHSNETTDTKSNEM